jgi:ABC-2 type transport system ATP-binding protein
MPVSYRREAELAVISVHGLRKTYAGKDAVAGIDFEVEAGEIVAVLGPNGAGKTTTVEILEGFRQRDGGEVSVLGADPAHGGRAFRERVGIVLQEAGIEPFLSAHEVLQLHAGYYPHPRDVDATMDLVGLTEHAAKRVKVLSGGQQRRLDLALGIIGDPELIFLDEPTTGFDPGARRSAWDVIANLRTLGKTIVLTTHYMDEAQHLADRVIVMSGGRIVAEGKPGELGGAGEAASFIRFTLPDGVTLADLPVPATMEGGSGVSIETRDPVRVLNKLTGWAIERGADLSSMTVSRPTLEDIYLELTRGAE